MQEIISQLRGCVNMVKFGERLKAARAAKHMSQQALADVIGKSLNTVGLYERGLRQPSLETLCLLADTLEVSVDYLLARTENKIQVLPDDPVLNPESSESESENTIEAE